MSRRWLMTEPESDSSLGIYNLNKYDYRIVNSKYPWVPIDPWIRVICGNKSSRIWVELQVLEKPTDPDLGNPQVHSCSALQQWVGRRFCHRSRVFLLLPTIQRSRWNGPRWTLVLWRLVSLYPRVPRFWFLFRWVRTAKKFGVSSRELHG